MKTRLLLVYAIATLLVGCTSSQQQQSAEKDLGRPETKKLEAATAVGYDGAAVRKSVDKVLDKNDGRTRDIDKQEAESK